MKTSKTLPPSFDCYGGSVACWERNKHPFSSLGIIDSGIGWVPIDFAENEIGFVPDGTFTDIKENDFFIAENQYGRKTAYPNKKYGKELHEKHRKEFENSR